MNRTEIKNRFYTALEELIDDTLPLKNRTFIELINDIVLLGGKFLLTQDKLNRVLLCCDRNIVTASFFKYFFSSEKVEDIKCFEEGVLLYRKRAMLCYGNFQYAFRKFREQAEIRQFFIGKNCEPKNDSDIRRTTPFEIKKIDKGSRWTLGHLTYDAEIQKLVDEKESGAITESQFQHKKNEYEMLADKTRAKARANLRKYITLDELDVYVATSMRGRDDYEEMAYFVENIFDKPPIEELNLRYFDPTQSYIEDRISAGLLECFLLKRAKVTVYHAGYNDTLGKDVELATTLAQGKPVIVYVPKEWKKEFNNLDARYEMFKETHPLGLQVAINTGVAHGVIVVRDVRQCAEVLRKVLLNQLDMYITEVGENIVLREKETESVIRVVSRNKVLSRTFWNYYLR